MKKSKLTGTLAVGGGLKQAVVPYIITGEENNGYSKGDILDANYVKQLINNNTIPSNISADTLTLKYGTIFTDGTFSIIDKNNLSKRYFNVDHGTAIFSDSYGLQMISSRSYYELRSDQIVINSGNLNPVFLVAKQINMILGGPQIMLNKDVFELPSGRFYFNKNNVGLTIDCNGSSISLDSVFTIEAPGGLRMGNGNSSYVTQFYSNDRSGRYKNGDPAIMWDQSWLRINKIHKPTQGYYEKDLFERVSDLETPKTTREANPKVGQCVFDTTLGKPIWCKTAKTGTTAAIWVDATGATV